MGTTIEDLRVLLENTDRLATEFNINGRMYELTGIGGAGDNEDTLIDLRFHAVEPGKNPCPFCNCGDGRVRIERQHATGAYLYQVHCQVCDARGSLAERREDAICAWNKATYNPNKYELNVPTI